MLQNPRKTLSFKKNMVYKIPPGGGGKPYPASGLNSAFYSVFFTLLVFVPTLFLLMLILMITNNYLINVSREICSFSTDQRVFNNFSKMQLHV